MKSKKSLRISAKSTELKQYRPGVKGLLTDALPEGIEFGLIYRRPSPYDELLKGLRAGGGRYLRFESVAARSALRSRARRLGVKLQFAEREGILWAALVPDHKAEPAKQPGRTMDAKTMDPHPAEGAEKPTLSDLALQAITARRRTAGEIISWMRSRGYTNGLDLTGTENLLRNLCKAGKIKLEPLGRNEDPDRTDRWLMA